MPVARPRGAARGRAREERFDSFYHATRHRLVLTTLALTGDLPAAYLGVRDAYTAAWSHWHKVSTLTDPLDWVRPRAWRLARRRHNTRLWHRRTTLPASESAVLAALARLPLGQRRVLLLTRLAGLSLPHAALELGIDQGSAEELRERATSAFADHLEIEAGDVRRRLLSLESAAAAARLPRASMIRRAGTKRRSTHTVAAAVTVVAVAVASGAFAYQMPERPRAVVVDIAQSGDAAVSQPVETDAEPTAADLLDEDQVARLGGRRPWRVTRTHDNTSGDGIHSTCQEDRFADPDGISAIVREFTTRGAPARSAVQSVEVSESAGQARRAFATTLGWYAGCRVARFQLINAYRVDDIGDQAQVLTARVWKRPRTSYSVAVARTGRLVTSTISRTVGAGVAAAPQLAQSLDDAVSMLCEAGGADDCAHRPTFTAVPPPPSGEGRGILAVADLPPVGRISRPWVGTESTPARVNPAMTICDQADFSGVKRTRTRSFLIPRAEVASRFGLTETYGEFANAAAARRFLARVRGRVERCEEHNEVARVSDARTVHIAQLNVESSLWDLDTEISKNESVPFRLGFVRVTDTVAQVTFSPTENDDITRRQFGALVVRAGDRLLELR